MSALVDIQYDEATWYGGGGGQNSNISSENQRRADYKLIMTFAKPRVDEAIVKNQTKEMEMSSKSKTNEFCYNILVKTFQVPIQICNTNDLKKSIKCYGNPYSNKMVSCILENVAVNPPALKSMVHGYFNQQDVRTVVPIRLLNDTETRC